MNLTEFKDSRKLWYATEKQLKKVIEDELKKVNRSDVNQDFEFEEKENVYLLKDYEYKNPVFEGEVEIPENIRGEDDSEKKTQVSRRL